MIVSLALLASASPAAVSAADVETGWGTVELLEYDDAGPAWCPQVAVDGSGNVVAVWQQQDGTRFHIWSSRYVAGEGWGDAELIENEPLASAINPRVAVSPAGDAFAVWEQVGAVGFDVWSNRYVAGEGWGDAELVESSSLGPATDPAIAVDGSGNAMVVWIQVDAYQQSLWSNRYSVGTGWGVPELVEADDSAASYNPDVAIDLSGNATAVWEQWGGPAMTIWSNWYVVGVGWVETEAVDTGAIVGSFDPHVAVDGSGNAVAAWKRWDGSHLGISANRYVVGTGWGDSEEITAGNVGDSQDPRVAASSSGDAFVVWGQYDVSHFNIWSSRYDVGAGWGPVEMAGLNNTEETRYPQVECDSSGNAIAVWEQWDGALMGIWSNRYVVGTGWGDSEMTHPDDWATATNPQVAVDSAGNAVAVWQMYDGTRHSIWSNRYVAPDTTAPTLAIDSPSDGSVAETSAVIVSGTTEPGSSLSVNGMLVSVSPDGSFSCTVSLVDGANVIEANATDASGNYVTATVTVTYVDPVHALEEDLAAALDEMAAIQDELDSVTDDLENASEELAEATDELDSVRDELDSVRDELSRTEDELSDARSQNLMLMVALIAFVVLTVVMSAMLFYVRKRAGGPGRDSANEPPPDG